MIRRANPIYLCQYKFSLFYKIYDKNFIYLGGFVPNAMYESTVADYLAEHPKMTGVLFTVLLLLTQSGTAAAGAAQVYIGP